jgi:hypothetical protein
MQYFHVSKIESRSFKVTKGQKLRIKLRLADRGDRLIDSAVYIRNQGLRVSA